MKNSWQRAKQDFIISGARFRRYICTLSVVSFEEATLMVGGNKGERIPFLTTREIMTVARRNATRPTSLILSNGFKEAD